MEARREDGKLVNHWTKAQRLDKSSGDPIKAAQERMKAEKERLGQLLSGAGKRLEDEKRLILEKFEKEKERIIREGDNTPPPRPFDYD